MSSGMGVVRTGPACSPLPSAVPRPALQACLHSASGCAPPTDACSHGPPPAGGGASVRKGWGSSGRFGLVWSLLVVAYCRVEVTVG